MISENDLLEPKKVYEESLRDSHYKNSIEYFDKLAKDNNIDIEANKATIATYHKKRSELESTKKKNKSKRGLRGFLIFVIVCLFIATLILPGVAVPHIETDWWMIIVAVVCLGLGIFLCILTHKKVTSVIKNLDTQISKLQNEIAGLRSEGYAQLQALNNSYEFNMHVDLVNATTPLIQMDRFFDIEKYEYLVEKFGYSDTNDESESTVHVQSGSILGNPFVIETTKTRTMGTHTYSGELTITYEVAVSTSNGTRYETRHQTLRAYVTKPKPFYNYEKTLYYGCEAAPELSFSRKPTNGKKMNENEMKKYITKTAKELDKLVEKKIDSGFMPLGNTEFEALFHAWDRNNETQFRLLFTPLAQRNMVDLIKNDGGYGDDFTFVKRNKLNVIRNTHNLSVDYVCEPNKFIDFDFEAAKERFVNYNVEYFKSFWFDIAPVLSIPLYQQLPTDEYIFQHKFRYNYSPMESSATANTFAQKVFEPDDCATELILNTKFIGTEGESDKCLVKAYGYSATERVEYVPVKGNDGYWHDVPVRWIEYEPVSKDSFMEVRRKEYSRQQIRDLVNSDKYRDIIKNKIGDDNIVYRNGFFSIVLDENSLSNSDLDLLLKD